MEALASTLGEEAKSAARTDRFYQPELDALRFFAFLAVLIHHGPTASGLFGIAVKLGGFGLSMFFLLSAYLITELLVRERERTGTVSIRSFFLRRALRIWPLYFAALAFQVVCSRILPDRFTIERTGITALALFIANWFWWAKFGLLAPLWSVSIEEQFYALWPMAVKFGGKAGAAAASIAFLVCGVLWIGVFSARGWHLWLDTPVEFIFFAAGALIAIAGRKGELPISTAGRVILFFAGLMALCVSAGMGVGTSGTAAPGRGELYAGYGCAVTGCAMIFAATLGIRTVPRWLAYLGKISYGLYVFHFGMIALARRIATPLIAEEPAAFYAISVDCIALALCVGIAAISYAYLESPFLRLKRRFEVVSSRPV